MAEAVRYVCGGCYRAIEAWPDGNPYYLDDDVCCGAEFMVDSLAPETTCPKCGSGDFAATFNLGGQRCPFCKNGVFTPDPNYHCIS